MVNQSGGWPEGSLFISLLPKGRVGRDSYPWFALLTLIPSHIAECLARGPWIPVFEIFGLTRPGIEPTTSRSGGEHYTQYIYCLNFLLLLFSENTLNFDSMPRTKQNHTLKINWALISLFDSHTQMKGWCPAISWYFGLKNTYYIEYQTRVMGDHVQESFFCYLVW